jgi:DNA transposition AAA+ family ATPase
MEDQTTIQAAQDVNWNITADQVAVGIKKNKPEYQVDLQYAYRYALDSGWSMKETAERYGVDASTLSRVLRGEYKNANEQVLPPPAKLLSRVRLIRDANRKTAGGGRVMTPTVRDIHTLCHKVWQQKLMGFLFGPSHIGKTEGLLWFKDLHNHGTTIYIDLQRANGYQDVYREIANALHLGADVPIAKLKKRVYETIDEKNFIIIDEFHHLTHSYQKNSAVLMIDTIKAIKDFCGCGMLICSTELGDKEIHTGPHADLLKQFTRRGINTLRLPKAMLVADVRAIVGSVGLELPFCEGDETWNNMLRDHPGVEHVEICDHIAWHRGIEALFVLLDDAKRLAGTTELTWAHVARAWKINVRGETPRAA